tara:strand:+ start:250 stop:432 length:183 start_codon:yes stop_codon:yes gene_type:complete
MTQIRRIRFFTAPVVQQMIPHPSEEKTIIERDIVRRVERSGKISQDIPRKPMIPHNIKKG